MFLTIRDVHGHQALVNDRHITTVTREIREIRAKTQNVAHQQVEITIVRTTDGVVETHATVQELADLFTK